jgi:hypothetical protein
LLYLCEPFLSGLQLGAERLRLFFRGCFEPADKIIDLRKQVRQLGVQVPAIPFIIRHGDRIADMPPRPPEPHGDSLSPELRRQIESQLDSAAHRTGVLAGIVVRFAKHLLWIVPVLLVLAFVTDSLVLGWSHDPLGTITIKRYYAVGLKNGKTEMYYADPETQTCVNSVFPHRGYSPCWYVRRHNVKEISI